jgi:hypothetical protein
MCSMTTCRQIFASYLYTSNPNMYHICNILNTRVSVNIILTSQMFNSGSFLTIRSMQTITNTLKGYRSFEHWHVMINLHNKLICDKFVDMPWYFIRTNRYAMITYHNKSTYKKISWKVDIMYRNKSTYYKDMPMVKKWSILIRQK